MISSVCKEMEDILMKNNVTELVFVLDRSGSMAGLEKDTIGGFNSMLAKQKKNEGKAYLTTVLFDDRYELLYNRIDLAKARPITEDQYYVRGATALLDAVGYTIQKIKHDIYNHKYKQHSLLLILLIYEDIRFLLYDIY